MEYTKFVEQLPLSTDSTKSEVELTFIGSHSYFAK